MRKALCLLAMALVFTGCARMVVRKHPGPKDTGIRFYRPKPYLFIGPNGPAKEEKTKNENAKANEEPTETTLSLVPVSMRVEYLPDYSEEYSIKMKPGLGTTKLGVTLTDGWNLTSVNAETDQQYDEILKSVADLVGSIGSLAGARDAKRDLAPDCQAESSVPFGYYEAVLACNECGTKELIGWRYIGFLACLGCPVSASVHRQSFECGQDPLYALVFKKGALRMERMDSLLDCPSCINSERVEVRVSDLAPEEVPTEEANMHELLTNRSDDAELPPLPQSSRPRRAKPR